MEKLKALQLPLIISLLSLLAMLFSKYQNIVEENSVLKLKLSDGLVVSKNTPKPLITIDKAFPETIKDDVALKPKVVNSITETNGYKAYEKTIAKIETSQESQNTEKVPFELQEVDYEWATLLETAVSDAFLTSLLLEEFTLENVECRSSTCEVRMPKGQEDTFHQSVLVLFALEEIGIKHNSFKVSPVAEDGTVVFYFDKYESE